MQFIDFKVPIIIHTRRIHTKCAGRDNNSQIQKTLPLFIFIQIYIMKCAQIFLQTISKLKYIFSTIRIQCNHITIILNYLHSNLYIYECLSVRLL